MNSTTLVPAWAGLVIAVAGSAACAGSSCAGETKTASPDAPALIHPEAWPLQTSPVGRSPVLEARLAQVLGRMSVEDKVAQIIQADIGSVTPEDVRRYRLGSILNGGNSAPEGDVRAPPEAWLALADAFWEASMDRSDGRVAIPIIWGTDAVHGHDVLGASVFPHNIGLGAAHDPDLVRDIGRATAREIRSTGIEWNFAPTLAVAQDDRWGRTYESYSEDPRVVAEYASAMVTGLQGAPGAPDFLGAERVLATPKHFMGDGGTAGGRDQGDNQASEEVYRDVHGAGYYPAIGSGAQSIMASFNSYRGRKLHGFRPMLNDVLVGRMGFDGFVVGDWNGHGQVEGCSPQNCPASLNAGVDMYMAPGTWKPLYENTLAAVRDGEIPVERLDQAVSRILRVKLRMGLFDAPKPSQRPLAGDFGTLASPEHKALSRRAVRSSLVLLKNNGGVLPLSPTARVLVAGDGADNIPKQAGGWTLSWQGTGNRNQHFPHGQSIYLGLREALAEHGGEAILSPDGTYSEAPDVAVVVYGEEPYAEFEGDRDNLDFGDERPGDILRRFHSAGIPTVSIFLSGRPLWVNPELNASDAFVAAWLPGDQGAGVADVLVAHPDGTPRHDFRGQLGFSWPAVAEGGGPKGPDDALFPFGYGLTYARTDRVTNVSEDSASERETDSSLVLVRRGDVPPEVRVVLADEGGARVLETPRGTSPRGHLATAPSDSVAQEDTRSFTWTGDAALSLVVAEPQDYEARAERGDMLRIQLEANGAQVGGTELGVSCEGQACEGFLDVTDALNGMLNQGFKTVTLSLACFAGAGANLSEVTAPFALRSRGPLSLRISAIEVVRGPPTPDCEL